MAWVNFNYKEWASRPEVKVRRAAAQKARRHASSELRTKELAYSAEYILRPGKRERANELQNIRYHTTERGTKIKAHMYKKYHSSGRTYRMRSHYKSKFDIVPEYVDERLADQGGHCATCPATHPGGKHYWHVDHIHGTKIIRGILCHKCNVMAGNGSIEDERRIEAILEYVKKYRLTV